MNIILSRSDVNKYKLKIDIGVKNVKVTGAYAINGQVFLIPIEGDGDFDIDLGNAID